MPLRLLAIAVLEAMALAAVLVLLPLRWCRRLLSPRGLQSLWTGTPIITMALKAQAERSLGVESRSLVTYSYYITDAFDINLSTARALPGIGYLVPFAVFVWTCLGVDRLHFYCDRGILPTHDRRYVNRPEFALYRLLGIQVFLWTYGSDVRTRVTTQALGEPNCCSECTNVGSACICLQEAHTRRYARLAREAVAIFSMGDMIEYTPGSRNDLFFWPVDLGADGGARYRPAYPTPSLDRPLRIVHAPNHQAFKGTRFLQRAVEELQREGLAIELVLVERLSNEEALQVYRSADIIFDQCLIGFHGYFALEGMALGKPVMCFIRKPRTYLLAPDECPIINTHVTTIKEDLRRLSVTRERLHETGRQGRLYIEKYFTISAFAQRLRAAYVDLGVMP